MKKIAIVGAGGFGQEVFCIWRDMLRAQNTKYEFIGFFDDAPGLLKNNFGKIVGTVEQLNIIDYPLEVAIAIGTPKHIFTVKQLINNNYLIFPNIIHPTVQFLGKDSINIGHGNIFALNTIISCNTKIGDFNVFNTRVTLGHDNLVGDYNVFSPNVQISGNVHIGNLNLLGFNSGIIQNKKMGNENTLGVGSILLRSIKDEGLYIGNPAIKVKF